jgi:SAM-dependent methyltransferase
MSNGWNESAAAWIDAIGERGDWAREFVLDPALTARLADQRFLRALDVGCGEGRLCRFLKSRSIPAIGLDPTEPLIDHARRRDPDGNYRLGRAEDMPFESGSFDLVISCLSLIDIADFRAAICEMSRVLAPGGTLLVANLSPFFTPAAATGWIRDATGKRVHYPVDRYLEEFPAWVQLGGARVENWHRPLSAYMSAFLGNGLILTHYDEPAPTGGDPERQASYRRVPWFVVMDWRKPPISAGSHL